MPCRETPARHSRRRPFLVVLTLTCLAGPQLAFAHGPAELNQQAMRLYLGAKLALTMPFRFAQRRALSASPIDIPLAVIGCGRSGTVYTQRVLKLSRLDVGHETLRPGGLVSWYATVDAERGPFDVPTGKHIDPKVLLHQVRHPLLVIPSVVKFSRISRDFIVQNCSATLADKPVVVATKYWHDWNRIALDKVQQRKDNGRSAHTYRIEAIQGEWPHITRLLGLDPNPTVLDRVPKNINSRSMLRGSIEEFEDWAMFKYALGREHRDLFRSVQRLAQSIGYDPQAPPPRILPTSWSQIVEPVEAR